MARAAPIVFRVVMIAAAGWAVWSGLKWYAAAGPDEPKGACADRASLRCSICEMVGRNDCHARPLTGCPATAVDYVSRFPDFKAKLKQQKDATSRWTAFKKQMEQIQNRSAVELCREQIDKMRKTEAEIPLVEACPGNSASSAKTSATPVSSEVTLLAHFRDCSEAKAKELGATVKQRQAVRVGEETAQLHSLIKEVTRITTDSIELLTEFREQANETVQTKCWLRGRIRDCSR